MSDALTQTSADQCSSFPWSGSPPRHSRGWGYSLPLEKSEHPVRMALICLCLTLMPGMARAQWVTLATMQVAQLDIATAEPNIFDVPCQDATCSGTVTLFIAGVPHQFQIRMNVPPK